MSAHLGKVLITSKSVAGSSACLKFLEDAGCIVDVKTVPLPIDEAWLIEQARDVDALVFAMEPITWQLIDSATCLKIIARPGVGYDTVDIAAATRRGIPVTIAAANDQSVADYAMALLLLAARGMIGAANSVQQHRWDRATGTEVWSKTLTIIGLGRIGKGVARRARGFDMRVLAVSEDRDEKFARDNGIEFVDLETGLRNADFVSLHTPLTPDTENMINRDTIGWMKQGAFVINTARGGLIDEQALAQAVASKHLGGAAVDVLRQQGANSPSPLIGVPGIIVTPHMATFATEAMDRVALTAARGIVAVLRGERPEGVVNPEIYAST
jgi:phosphoglycerate dehydrogenase-like enzyme